jgi:hypothetical protein
MMLPMLWVLLAVVILAAGYAMLRRRREVVADQAETLERPDTDTLTYTLPPGQDPALVVSALQRDGFTALSPVTGGRPQVVIECPQGRDHSREQARRVLESISTTGFEGEPMDTDGVRFDDEER